MTVTTSSVTGRRVLRFESLDELEQEARRVASQPGRTLGNWSTAQILDHLARSIQASFDGPEKKAPWLVRAVVAPLIRRRILTRGMSAGFALPQQLSHFLPDEDAATETALKKLQVWLARLNTETPTVAHPALGRLSHEDWIRLTLRHGELHLSFIVPDDA